MIALPGFATFYGLLAETWGLAYVNEVLQTINAVTVLLGALIGISTANYNKEVCNKKEV